jgi:ubiquinone/menaquinone biosynthesis C-methylase UbiE
MIPASSFSYEAKTWGAARLEPRPWFMNGLKLRYLLDDLKTSRGKVLDVGCGAGSVAKAVKRERPDLEVFGCDVSEAALNVATTTPEDVNFRRASAEKLPFNDAEIDFVWIFDVLEHVDDPEQVLLEVRRVLRPGGGFHIVLPLEGGGLYRLIGCGTRWTAKQRHGGHIQIFSAARFKELATRTGLPVAKSRWSYHFLLQVLDIVYFSWLDWHGNVSGSVEDMAARRRGGVGVLMRIASTAVACLAWTEARLLRAFPGCCGHFMSLKKA